MKISFARMSRGFCCSPCTFALPARPIKDAIPALRTALLTNLQASIREFRIIVRSPLASGCLDCSIMMERVRVIGLDSIDRNFDLWLSIYDVIDIWWSGDLGVDGFEG